VVSDRHDPQPCTGAAHDNRIEPGALPPDLARYLPARVAPPVYGPGPHGNRRGLTALRA
jgi:hypothetical protein